MRRDLVLARPTRTASTLRHLILPGSVLFLTRSLSLVVVLVVLAVAASGRRALARARAVPGARGAAARAGRASTGAGGAIAAGLAAGFLGAVALLRGAHANVRGVGVALELGVIQSADRLLHVLAVGEVHHALAVSLDVREDHVANLAHEVLQVLPAASAGKVSDLNGPLGSASATTRLGSTSTTSSAIALGGLHAQSIAIKVVTVTAANGVLCIPVVVKANERKSGRTRGSLQVDLPDLAISISESGTGNHVVMWAEKHGPFLVLVEQIIELRFSDVQRKVSNVDARHDWV